MRHRFPCPRVSKCKGHFILPCFISAFAFPAPGTIQHPPHFILLFYFRNPQIKTHHSWRKFKCGVGTHTLPVPHIYPLPLYFCGKHVGGRFLKLRLWNYSMEVTNEGSNMLSTMSNMSLTVVLGQNSYIWATHQFKLTVGGGGRLEWTHENLGL